MAFPVGSHDASTFHVVQGIADVCAVRNLEMDLNLYRVQPFWILAQERFDTAMHETRGTASP
jgi:hypothetical protein